LGKEKEKVFKKIEKSCEFYNNSNSGNDYLHPNINMLQ